MEEHLSEGRIVALFSSEVATSEVDRVIPHIVACPACWARTAEVVATLKARNELAPTRRGRPPGSPYGDARLALVVLMEAEEQRSVDYLRAKGWWAELRELPSREQADKFRTVAALQRPEVLETILQEARLACLKDPYSGEHLALSAHQLVDHLPTTVLPARAKDSFRLSAMTVVANSRRLAGDWQGALEAISGARKYLWAGTVQPRAEAYLLSIHASLVGDMGRLEEAVLLEGQAAEIYKNADDSEGLATVSVKAADTLQKAGNATEAILMAEEALAVMPQDCCRLKMLARSIITESLIALNRLQAALRSYEATKPLYHADGGELTLFQAEYLEAKLLDAFGHVRESEKLFRSAIAGLTDLEAHRPGLVARFALFESLFHRDALDKAARLCGETVTVLEQTGAHSQMCQVWKDLLAAVKAKALTAAHLAEVRDYLVRHWAIPASRAPLARP